MAKENKDTKPAPVLTMYEISGELLELQSLLMETGGELSEENEAKLDALVDLRDKKADGYYRIIRNFKLTAEAYKAEIDRLTRAYKAAQNGAERVLRRLEEQMKLQGEEKLETDIGYFRLVASGQGSVTLKEGIQVSDLPERFVTQKDPTENKRELMNALKSEDPEALKYAEIISPSPSIRMY